MSNRQIAVLVLIAMFSAIFWAVYYYFVRNVSELRVSLNGPETAKISLMKGNADVLSLDCAKDCTISKIPPLDYRLVIKAEGFKTYEENLSIRTTDRIYRIIDMEREASTEIYKEDRKEAISEIRSKRAILAETGAEDAGREYYGQYRGMDYYADKVPTFKLMERSSDGSDKTLFQTASGAGFGVVLGEGGLLWIDAGGASSLFDLETGDRDYPALPVWITKVAKTYRPGYFVATDADSAYSYDRASKSLDKVPLYSDFVPTEDGKIIALVRKGDEKRASLLNLGSSAMSYVFTDRGAGSRKVIYSTDKTIANIHDAGTGSVILEFDDGTKETLKNFE